MKFVAPALILAVVVFLFSAVSVAHAQHVGGGVQVPGEWWLGEGLKQGDYFSYRLCHVDYKECTFFEVDFWIQGDKQVGSESKWLAQAVVYEGDKVYRGELEFDKNVAQPSRSTDNLERYRDAIQYSISWLSSFATSHEGDKGPKAFNMSSWGKLGYIGGEQVAPKAAESVTVPAGTFDTIRISWKSGGAMSSVWIVDEFPFPVKASTWLNIYPANVDQYHYVLTLLDYKENVQTDPFIEIKTDKPMPLWIKDNAELWTNDIIDDDTFATGLQYMIQEGIIVISDTSTVAGSEDNQIPSWFKGNAKLWASGMIDDDTFATGIQYLIENGIIKIVLTDNLVSSDNEIPSNSQTKITKTDPAGRT